MFESRPRRTATWSRRDAASATRPLSIQLARAWAATASTCAIVSDEVPVPDTTPAVTPTCGAAYSLPSGEAEKDTSSSMNRALKAVVRVVTAVPRLGDT